MPAVTCPGCQRRIELPPDEMGLPSITCAGCERVFCPAEHVPPAGPSLATILQRFHRPSGRSNVVEQVAIGVFFGIVIAYLFINYFLR